MSEDRPREEAGLETDQKSIRINFIQTSPTPAQLVQLTNTIYNSIEPATTLTRWQKWGRKIPVDFFYFTPVVGGLIATVSILLFTIFSTPSLQACLTSLSTTTCEAAFHKLTAQSAPVTTLQIYLTYGGVLCGGIVGLLSYLAVNRSPPERTTGSEAAVEMSTDGEGLRVDYLGNNRTRASVKRAYQSVGMSGVVVQQSRADRMGLETDSDNLLSAAEQVSLVEFKYRESKPYGATTVAKSPSERLTQRDSGRAHIASQLLDVLAGIDCPATLQLTVGRRPTDPERYERLRRRAQRILGPAGPLVTGKPHGKKTESEHTSHSGGQVRDNTTGEPRSAAMAEMADVTVRLLVISENAAVNIDHPADQIADILEQSTPDGVSDVQYREYRRNDGWILHSDSRTQRWLTQMRAAVPDAIATNPGETIWERFRTGGLSISGAYRWYGCRHLRFGGAYWRTAIPATPDELGNLIALNGETFSRVQEQADMTDADQSDTTDPNQRNMSDLRSEESPADFGNSDVTDTADDSDNESEDANEMCTESGGDTDSHRDETEADHSQSEEVDSTAEDTSEHGESTDERDTNDDDDDTHWWDWWPF